MSSKSRDGDGLQILLLSLHNLIQLRIQPMLHHDSIQAEEIARKWHQIGLVVSVGATVSGILMAVVAGVGAGWHLWAARQHEARIRRLRGGNKSY